MTISQKTVRTAALVLAAIALILFTQPLDGAAADVEGCYTDPAYGFSIYVPPDWTRQNFKQENAQVYMFRSPSPNIFVQLRMFPAGPGDNPGSVATLFESNTFPSSQTLKQTRFTLNSVPGLLKTYQMVQHGQPIRINAFYALFNGRSTALWSAVPETAAQSVHDQVYGVFKTFRPADEAQSYQPQQHVQVDPRTTVPPPPAAISGDAAVVKLTVGTRMAGDYQVVPQTTIPDTAREIFAAFQWQGRAGGVPFSMKWINLSKKKLFQDIPIAASPGRGGWGTSSIIRGDLRWPLGKWAVEIHHGGKLLKRETFSMVPE